MTPRIARLARTAYFTVLLLAVLAIMLRTLPSDNKPLAECNSRWPGEIVAIEQDSAGNFYCKRIDYAARRRG